MRMWVCQFFLEFLLSMVSTNSSKSLGFSQSSSHSLGRRFTWHILAKWFGRPQWRHSDTYAGHRWGECCPPHLPQARCCCGCFLACDCEGGFLCMVLSLCSSWVILFSGVARDFICAVVISSARHMPMALSRVRLASFGSWLLVRSLKIPQTIRSL